MSDNTQCTICLEPLKSPRELPCHHSFCQTCLQEYIDKLVKEVKKTIQTFDCPNCRKSTPIPSPLKPATEWATQFPQFPKGEDVPKPKTIIQRKCSPCEYEGDKVNATRYCIDCREYMCEDCFRFHKRMAFSRKHKVIMASDIRTETAVPGKERCSCRVNKSLKYHCLDHQVYCCSTCRTDSHTNCRDVRNIASMSEYIRFYSKADKAMEDMDEIRKNLQKIIDLSEDNKKSLATAKHSILQTIQKIHTDLKSLLKKIEDVLTEEINVMCQDVSTALTSHIERCRAAIDEVDTSTSVFKSVQSKENNDQLYISHNRFLQEISQLKKALKETAADTMKSELSFAPSELTKSLPSVLQSFGKSSITTKKDVFTPTIPEDIKLRKSKANKLKTIKAPSPCNPTGVAALPNGCCVVVNNNISVLMFDRNDKQTASLSMPGAWDVCVTGENEVAVTTRDRKKIHFLSSDNGLVCTRTISTNEQCYGIAYCVMTRELVITTRNPGSVHILTLTGDVVKTIEKDKDGQRMFSGCAFSVTVNDTGDMLYVSDWYKGVIGVDRDGHVKFIYTDVKNPRGISIDGDGNIYVCGLGSREVHQLSSDGSRIQVLLSSTDPCGLFFNRRNNTMFVTYGKANEIVVYRMQ